MKNPLLTPLKASGFTLIEALMTMAIIGIMTALVVSAFSNAGTDSAKIISRQQQAAIQEAVEAWVNGSANRTDVINATTGDGKLRTIAEIQTTYNNATTALARLELVQGYLDGSTASYLITSTTNSAKIASDALNTTNQNIQMPNWTTATVYPQVTLNSN
jgi:prepilin-type N-terminal cleavage/methylation domain-containing protein